MDLFYGETRGIHVIKGISPLNSTLERGSLWDVLSQRWCKTWPKSLSYAYPCFMPKLTPSEGARFWRKATISELTNSFSPATWNGKKTLKRYLFSWKSDWWDAWTGKRGWLFYVRQSISMVTSAFFIKQCDCLKSHLKRLSAHWVYSRFKLNNRKCFISGKDFFEMFGNTVGVYV